MKNARSIILMISFVGLLLPLSSCGSGLSSSEGRKVASSIIALHQTEIASGDYTLGSEGWSSHDEARVQYADDSSSIQQHTFLKDTAVVPNEFFTQTSTADGVTSTKRLYHVGEHYYQEIGTEGYEISSARFFGLFKGQWTEGGKTYSDHDYFYSEISYSSGFFYLQTLAALLALPEGTAYSQTLLTYLHGYPAEFRWTPISSDGANNLVFSFHRVDGVNLASSFLTSYHDDSTVTVKEGFPSAAKNTYGYRFGRGLVEGVETQSFSFTTPSFTPPSSLPSASYQSSSRSY